NIRLELDKADIARLARMTADGWSLVWQSTFLAKALQLVGAPPPLRQTLRRIYGDRRASIAEMLRITLLSERLQANAAAQLTDLRRAFNDARKSAAIFLDGADEIFLPGTGLSAARLSAAWRASQVGLLLAISEIERSTRTLNVFTTLRADAL